MKTFLTLAILSSIAASPAMAERFTRDGEVYDYQVKSIGGDTLIVGTNMSSGQDFRLRVAGTQVSGTFGRSAVKFRVSPEIAAASGASATVLAAK